MQCLKLQSRTAKHRTRYNEQLLLYAGLLSVALPGKLKTWHKTDHGKVRKVGSSNVNCTKLCKVDGIFGWVDLTFWHRINRMKWNQNEFLFVVIFFLNLGIGLEDKNSAPNDSKHLLTSICSEFLPEWNIVMLKLSQICGKLLPKQIIYDMRVDSSVDRSELFSIVDWFWRLSNCDCIPVHTG